MSTQEFVDRLRAAWPDLSEEGVTKAAHFYELVLDENTRQNLTRLTSPSDFVEGHVLDVKALFESGLADFPALDLGAGGGVPGLLAAALRGDKWVLAESEGRKADFLRRAAQELGLSHVGVFGERGELVLKKIQVKSVTARAVGKVEKIFGWLGGCSTWNNLVLFKGPGWSEEWEQFQTSKFREDLRIEKAFEYTVGQEGKKRVIVRLARVPRGTKRGKIDAPLKPAEESG